MLTIFSGEFVVNMVKCVNLLFVSERINMLGRRAQLHE